MDFSFILEHLLLFLVRYMHIYLLICIYLFHSSVLFALNTAPLTSRDYIPLVSESAYFQGALTASKRWGAIWLSSVELQEIYPGAALL